jgi:hypothetical protein
MPSEKPKGRSRLWTAEEDAIIREIAGEKGNISPLSIGMMRQQMPNRTHDSIRVRAKMLIMGTARPPKVTVNWPRVPKDGDAQHVRAIMVLAEKIERRKREEARA